MYQPLADILRPKTLDEVYDLFAFRVLVKSVEEGDYLVDYLYDRTTDTLTPHPKKKLVLDDRNGTGDTLSSAIATYLAKGDDLSTAVERAEATSWPGLATTSA